MTERSVKPILSYCFYFIERFCRFETIQEKKGLFGHSTIAGGDCILTLSDFKTLWYSVTGRFGWMLVSKNVLYGKHGDATLERVLNGKSMIQCIVHIFSQANACFQFYWNEIFLFLLVFKKQN